MKTRVFHTKFWEDSFIAGLSPEHKLLFCYFISNRFINLIGCYECSDRQIIHDTGLSLEKVVEGKELLEKSRRIIFPWEDWVIVSHVDRYQTYTGIKNDVAKKREFGLMPDIVKDFYISITGNTPINTPIDTVAIRTRNQNPEIINLKPETNKKQPIFPLVHYYETYPEYEEAITLWEKETGKLHPNSKLVV